MESLRDLASFRTKDRRQPMLNLSRQRIGQVMKDTAVQVGIETIPTPSGTPTAATASCEEFQSPCCTCGWDTPLWSTPSLTSSWPGRTTNSLAGCEHELSI